MYRLLVVDDEPHVTDWLSELFSELNDMPLEVYKAYSAKEALEWVSRLRIDIVLADINMPKMNGLTMMNNIKMQWPECKVIFLTGYNEFDYIYEATRNDASGYLLKIEKDSEIVAAVRKVIDQIEETYKLEDQINKSTTQLRQALPLMKKDFALTVLEKMNGGLQPDEEQLASLGIPLSIKRPVYLLLGRIDNPPPKLNAALCNEMYFKIDFSIERFISPSYTIFFSPIDNNLMLWLMQQKSNSEKSADSGDYDVQSISKDKEHVFLRDMLDIVQVSVRESFSITVSFALTDSAYTWSDIPSMYDRIKEKLDMSSNAETIAIDIKSTNSEKYDYRLEPIIKEQTVFEFRSCLERCNKAVAVSLLEGILKSCKSIKSMKYPPAMEAYYSISLSILSFINKNWWTARNSTKGFVSNLMCISEHGSWEEAFKFLISATCSILDAQFELVSKEEESAVNHLKHYIDENLSKDISLVKLAEVVHFNPSYLSRFFKKATGENLTDYIFNAKINKARELLENEEIKIHEVALAVGFKSSTYFAKFFRRMTGINPNEYRNGTQ